MRRSDSWSYGIWYCLSVLDGVEIPILFSFQIHEQSIYASFELIKIRILAVFQIFKQGPLLGYDPVNFLIEGISLAQKFIKLSILRFFEAILMTRIFFDNGLSQIKTAQNYWSLINFT